MTVTKESLPFLDTDIRPRDLRKTSDYSTLNEQELLEEIGKMHRAKIDKQILTHFDELVHELNDRFPEWFKKDINKRELAYFDHLRTRILETNILRSRQRKRIISSTTVLTGYIETELKDDLISEGVRLSKDDEVMKALVRAGIVNREGIIINKDAMGTIKKYRDYMNLLTDIERNKDSEIQEKEKLTDMYISLLSTKTDTFEEPIKMALAYKYMEAIQRDLERMDRVVLRGSGGHSYYIAKVDDGITTPDTGTEYERAFNEANSRDLIDVVRITSLIRGTFRFNEKGLVGERGLISHLLESQEIMDQHGSRIMDPQLLLVHGNKARIIADIDKKIADATSTTKTHDTSIRNYKELLYLKDFIETGESIRHNRNRKMLEEVNKYRVFLKTNALIPGFRDKSGDITEEGTLGIIERFVSGTRGAAIIGAIFSLFAGYKKSSIMLLIYGLAGGQMTEAGIGLAGGKKKPGYSDDDLDLVKRSDIKPTLANDYNNSGYITMLPELIAGNKELEAEKTNTIQTLPGNVIIAEVFQRFIDMTEAPQAVAGVTKNPLEGVLIGDTSMKTANVIHSYLASTGQLSTTDGYGKATNITAKYIQSMLHLLNEKRDSGDKFIVDTLTRGGLDISRQRYDDVEFIDDDGEGEDVFNDELNKKLKGAFNGSTRNPASREDKMKVMEIVANIKRLNPTTLTAGAKAAAKAAKGLVTDVPKTISTVLTDLGASTPLNNRVRPIIEKYQEFTELDDELEKFEGPLDEMIAPLTESKDWLLKKTGSKADQIMAIHDVISVYQEEKKELQKITVPNTPTSGTDYFLKLRERYDNRLQQFDQVIARKQQEIQDLLLRAGAGTASINISQFSSIEPTKVEELYEHMEDQIKELDATTLSSISDVVSALGKPDFVKAFGDLDIYSDPTTGLPSMSAVNPTSLPTFTSLSKKEQQAAITVYSLQQLIEARAPDLVSGGKVDMPKIKQDIEKILSDYYTERQTKFGLVSGIAPTVAILQNNTDISKMFVDLQKAYTDYDTAEVDAKMLEVAKTLNLTLPSGTSGITREKFAEELAKKVKTIEAGLPSVDYLTLAYADALTLLTTTRAGVQEVFKKGALDSIWEFTTVKTGYAHPGKLTNINTDLNNSLGAVLSQELASVNVSAVSTSTGGIVSGPTFEIQVDRLMDISKDIAKLDKNDFEITDIVSDALEAKFKEAVESYLTTIASMPHATLSDIEAKNYALDDLIPVLQKLFPKKFLTIELPWFLSEKGANLETDIQDNYKEAILSYLPTIKAMPDVSVLDIKAQYDEFDKLRAIISTEMNPEIKQKLEKKLDREQKSVSEPMITEIGNMVATDYSNTNTNLRRLLDIKGELGSIEIGALKIALVDGKIAQLRTKFLDNHSHNPASGLRSLPGHFSRMLDTPAIPTTVPPTPVVLGLIGKLQKNAVGITTVQKTQLGGSLNDVLKVSQAFSRNGSANQILNLLKSYLLID